MKMYEADERLGIDNQEISINVKGFGGGEQ